MAERGMAQCMGGCVRNAMQHALYTHRQQHAGMQPKLIQVITCCASACAFKTAFLNHSYEHTTLARMGRGAG